MDKTNATVREASPKDETPPPELLSKPEEKTAPPALLTKPEEKTDMPIVPKVGDDARNAPRPAAPPPVSE
jgi:hypothetical protein